MPSIWLRMMIWGSVLLLRECILYIVLMECESHLPYIVISHIWRLYCITDSLLRQLKSEWKNMTSWFNHWSIIRRNMRKLWYRDFFNKLFSLLSLYSFLFSSNLCIFFFVCCVHEKNCVVDFYFDKEVWTVVFWHNVSENKSKWVNKMDASLFKNSWWVYYIFTVHFNK